MPKRTEKYLQKHNLEIDYPVLCVEWNYNKNKLLPNQYFKSSLDKVWWKCAKNHEWKSSIHDRVFYLTECPYCTGNKVCEDNCLAILFPDIAKEWNFEKNEFSPRDYMAHSNKKVWWKCDKEHEWKATIAHRVNGTKCTQCAYGYVSRDRDAIYNLDKTQKECKICKIFYDLSNFRVRGNDKSGYYRDNTCFSCGKKLLKDYLSTEKGIAVGIIHRVKARAKRDKILFDLDQDWIFNRLNEIGWKCELTGLEFRKLNEGTGNGWQWNSLSVDKIIPSKGYTKGNVRFILNQLNIFKQDGDDDRMYMLAEALLDYRVVLENEK